MNYEDELSLLQVTFWQKYGFDFVWLRKKWSKSVKYFADKNTFEEVSLDTIQPGASIGVATKFIPTNFTFGKTNADVFYLILWRFSFAFKDHTEKVPFDLDKDRVAKLISTPIGGSEEALQKIESLVTHTA